MKTIAIIDRHIFPRLGLRHFLKENFKGVDIFDAETYEVFQDQFSNKIPDIFILILNNEELADCLKTISEVKKTNETAEVIVYDAQPALEKMTAIIKAGARGYLCMQDDLSEWIKCVKLVSNGKNYLDNYIINLLLTPITSPPKHSSTKLTDRENEIAKYIVDGLSTTSIAKIVNRKSSTISTIKASIFRKMKVSNAIKLRDVLINNKQPD